MARARAMTAGLRVAVALGVALLAGVPATRGESSVGPRLQTVPIRGVEQTLHVYGAGDQVAIVTSGDGGWTHLGPEVAQLLVERGYHVVGFDAKAYLSSFTSRSRPLQPRDVPGDYEALARATGSARPLLVGVSEGAGLSVLAASSPPLKDRVAGVVALGLPDRNELAWRFRDSLIYFTGRTPNEPTFSVRDVVGSVAPVPLAIIHSRRDEFVPVPEVQAILERAVEPKRLWLVDAGDHRFSGARPPLRQILAEVLAWIASPAAS